MCTGDILIEITGGEPLPLIAKIKERIIQKNIRMHVSGLSNLVLKEELIEVNMSDYAFMCMRVYVYACMCVCIGMRARVLRVCSFSTKGKLSNSDHPFHFP